jgi:hypothetical protein
MPATSKTQQKLFGWALACKRGESDNCPVNVKKLADSMSEEELEKFAKTPHKGLPAKVEESVIECIVEMDSDGLDLLEKETKTEVPVQGLKPSDIPVTKDVKTPSPVVPNPEVPPGYIKADKRNDPGFFTPSLFKRPGDKKAKRDTRTMDFAEFLKRINYRTHDDTLQKGHGQNLTGKGPA